MVFDERPKGTWVTFAELDRLKGGGEFAVYMTLLRFASWDDDRSCYPSHKTISEFCGVSVSTVQRSLKRLEADGLVKTEQRVNETSGQTSNLYFVAGVTDPPGHIDRPPRSQRPTPPVILTDELEPRGTENLDERDGATASPVTDKWGEHLSLSRKAYDALRSKNRLPDRGRWNSISPKRKRWITARMKELGTTSPTEFWREVYRLFLRADPSHTFLTFDLGLDFRPVGVEHWPRLREGYYDKPFTKAKPKFADDGPELRYLDG